MAKTRPKFRDIVTCIHCGDTHEIDGINLEGDYDENDGSWVCNECIDIDSVDNYIHGIDDMTCNSI